MKDIAHHVVELPCSVEEAWGFILDPAWLGEAGAFDAVPGGEGWVTSDGDTKYLVVEEIDPEERFVYRWASFTDEPTRVEIAVAPSSGGTTVEIIESPLEAKMMSLALR